MEPRFRGGQGRSSCAVFARIHETNLKKQGVLPLTFADPADLRPDRRGRPHQHRSAWPTSPPTCPCGARSPSPTAPPIDFEGNHTMSDEQIEWFKAGGALNIIRQRQGV